MSKRTFRLAAGAVVCASAALGGCGAEAPRQPVESEPVRTLESEGWVRTEREYPFVEDGGAQVCEEWTRPLPDGNVEVTREHYRFDRMNLALQGKLDLDAAMLAAVRAAGVTEVATCEHAREFDRAKAAYTDAHVPFDSTPRESVADIPEEVPLVGSEPADKVRDGREFDHFPNVRLRLWQTDGKVVLCTGSLISPYHILTAAQCIRDGGMKVAVDYGELYGNDWCLTSTDCDAKPATFNMMGAVHPEFTGGIDTPDDLGVLYHLSGSPWRVIGSDANYFVRLIDANTNVADSFWAQGYGSANHEGDGSGIGRRGKKQEGISWQLSGEWGAYATGGYGHPCRGDWGSGAINTTMIKDGNGNPLDLLIGVFSNYDGWGTNHCPQLGDKFRYTKVTSQYSFIAGTLRNTNGQECTKHANNGIRYRKCFAANPPPKPPI